MGRSHLCKQAVPKDPAHLLQRPCDPRRPSGLSLGFPRLSPSRRQLDYVLLARPPLYSPCGFHVRLACLIHAANVRSEPGSNPSLEKFFWLLSLFPSSRRRIGFLPQPPPLAGQQPGRLAHTLSFEATQNVKDRLAPASRRHVRGREKVANDRNRSSPA